MLWPVCISSMCPFRVPVRSHWAANWRWERDAMSTVSTIESGTVRSEMTASSGLMRNIISRIPITVNSDVMSWVRLCWSVFEMLSMSFVTRLRMSPRGWSSK